MGPWDTQTDRQTDSPAAAARSGCPDRTTPEVYTVLQKTPTFFFVNNSLKNGPILIILGRKIPRKFDMNVNLH